MPKVTINEIDQSRYVVNSQRAPLIALTPVISSWGDTEKATLIQSESDFYNVFGNALANPIENDITRNYALNLLNSGVSLLAKRIKPTPDFEPGKSTNLNSLYSSMNLPAVPTKEILTGYRDTTDQTFYVPIISGEIIVGYTHYTSDGTSTIPVTTYISTGVTSETTGRLLVIADNTTEQVYKIYDTETDGTKLIVANDAPDFDPDTQIKLEDVTPVYPEEVAEVDKYTKLVDYDPYENDTTVVRISVVNQSVDVPVQEGDYVVTLIQYVANQVEAEIFVKDTLEIITNYSFQLSAKAKYFGSYGDKVALRIIKTTTNSTDVLSTNITKTVTFATYVITKKISFDENGQPVDPVHDNHTIDNEDVNSAKLIDTVTFSLDDATSEKSITKYKNYISNFEMLSDLSFDRLTDNDSNDITPISLKEYEEIIDSLIETSGGNMFVLTGGKDYFETIGESVVVTNEPLDQFRKTLADKYEGSSNSDVTNINEFWDDFKDPYIYDFDFIVASGFTNTYVKPTVDGSTDYGSEEDRQLHTNMLKLANARGDAVACLDAPIEYTHLNVIQYFNYISNADTAYSYGTAHGPWCKIRDITTGNYIMMPGSFIFLATIGTNLTKNSESQIWYAPAGVARASTNLVVESQYEVGSTILNEWQNNESDSNINVRVNPIMKIFTYGYTIYGNSTLMQDLDGYTKSALQSLGTRVLCNVVKKAIFSICVALTFEPNDYILWAEFKTRLSNILEQMKVNGGITDYNIVMDDTTVTDEAKNNLTVPGKVFISPTRPAEFFDIDFTITQAGVTFDESKSDVIG